MRGLKIYLDSFTINSNLAYESEEMRISVTAFPEESKQSIVINTEDMRNCQKSFKIDITENTKKLLFVFWQKNIVQCDPIIASTIIYSKELPKSFDDPNNNKEYTIGLLEPLKSKKNQVRKIIGQMKVKFSLTDPYYPPEGEEGKLGKLRLNNENENMNNSIFTDGVYNYY